MFSYVTLEQRVPRELTDEVLRSLSAEFDGLYSDLGRRSIAPEYVLRALLLQGFFSVRSERQLVEQIDYNLLFRWFVAWGWGQPFRRFSAGVASGPPLRESAARSYRSVLRMQEWRSGLFCIDR